MSNWRVYWIPQNSARNAVPKCLLPDWADLTEREDGVGIEAGDPIFLSPDYQVDRQLGKYGKSAVFRRYTAETQRNYTTDICLLLNFLWQRGKTWISAVARDLEDYEHWRRLAEENPRRIGGNKWDRELAAFASLYRWAEREGHVLQSPVTMKSVPSRDGTVATAPAAKAKDSRQSNVHWLTPRTWRLWIGVGLQGHTRDALPDAHWLGRLEDRNVAYTRLLTSSGLRRTEGGSLLTFEVPTQELAGCRYYRGRIAAAVTRSKKSRTFYVSAEALGEIEAYVAATRVWSIRQAQKKGLYFSIPGIRLVTEVKRRQTPVVRWRDRTGSVGERQLDKLTVNERMTLFTDGPHGPEPLWLWLNERGLPFKPHSWEGVFRSANERCEAILTPPERVGLDPYQEFAPYATPHSARHSFALYMLVVLNKLMDERYGLTPEERRDFRQLYGDPWFMVQNLLGHASRDTTINHYLAPVADLQLRAMLTSTTDPGIAPTHELDATFARVARESLGIQDFDYPSAPTTGAQA